MSSTDDTAHANRLDLYRYLGAENAEEYLAIMRLFTATLLADLAAADVAGQLRESGLHLDTETVEERCTQLVRWGNLVRSVRDARVATIADWRRSRARFQVSKLGGRVQRQAEEVLAAGEGAREVARELLEGIADLLRRITERLRGEPPVDPGALATEVTQVFTGQREFTDSVRDFYAYLNTVLSRYDLAGEEYAQFKGLLLDYVDLLSADVQRHAPVVVARLEELRPLLDELLDVLASLPGLVTADGSPVERSGGRVRADWDQLHAWYAGQDGVSGPTQLRGAAEQALGQLLTNAKRMLSTASAGVSRRSDLLRLASLFAQTDEPGADPDEPHRLFAAAFGAYPARHLLLGPGEGDTAAGPSDSWWDSPPVDVPMTLRERGDRAARGRTARVPDPGLDRAALQEVARAELLQRRAAAAELVAVGELDGARTSPAARDLLLHSLGRLLAVHQTVPGPDAPPALDVDHDLDLAVRAVALPDVTTVVHADDGSTTVHGLRLTAAPAGDPR